MAGNKVEFDFIAHSESIKSALKDINSQLREINSNLKTTNTSGTKSTKEHGSAVKGLASRFVGLNLVVSEAMKLQRQVVQYVSESVTKFREFQTRIAEVSTIMGSDFKDSLAGLQAGVESLSLQFGKDTSDMAKGLYDILSAAFSANEAIALLGTSTKAAIAGLSTVRDSVDIFTTVLNTYGMSAYEATHVSDVLFQSVVRGKFQFEQLESALGFIVPIAAQAGISFDELMASLSTATRHGLHLDMAARGLALAIQNIINPSAQATQAAMKYGIQLNGLSLRIKGLQGFFQELNESSKLYGKQVLNDIIPNMRSLRVAMILAGDEGVLGLAEDLDYLVAATGRTNDALTTMMDTSGFVSSQITQQWEQTQRDVGQKWDELILGGQQAITNLVDNWTHYIPVVGGIFRIFDDYKLQSLSNWKQEKILALDVLNTEKSRVQSMQDYLSIKRQIESLSSQVSEKMQKGEDYTIEYDKLQFLEGLSTQLQDDFNAAFGEPILGGIRNLDDLDTTLNEIEIDVLRIKDELLTPISVGWGDSLREVAGSLNKDLQAKQAEQLRVDVSYDVDQALRDSTYIWKTNNKEVQDAVSVMREYEEAQKAAKKATNELNEEMVRLQIEALQIQIVGMMRRRGLNRSEEKRLKQIQIEQAKLRLEGMKAEYEATDITKNTYEEKKEFVDDYIASLKHEEYTLKYTLDTEIESLELMITSERELLAQRREEWATTDAAINYGAATLAKNLKAIMDEPGLADAFKNYLDTDIWSMYQNALGMLSGRSTFSDIFGDTSSLFGYSRGIEYVPETRPALLHRGESVVPSGRRVGGGTQIGTVVVNVQSISDIDSPEKFAQVLAQATDKGVIAQGSGRARNKNTGNTYRVI